MDEVDQKGKAEHSKMLFAPGFTSKVGFFSSEPQSSPDHHNGFSNTDLVVKVHEPQRKA